LFLEKKKKKKEKASSAPGYIRGIEPRNTTPHAINGLVEVKKVSLPPPLRT
jgi:hypothetical protein